MATDPDRPQHHPGATPARLRPHGRHRAPIPRCQPALPAGPAQHPRTAPRHPRAAHTARRPGRRHPHLRGAASGHRAAAHLPLHLQNQTAPRPPLPPDPQKRCLVPGRRRSRPPEKLQRRAHRTTAGGQQHPLHPQTHAPGLHRQQRRRVVYRTNHRSAAAHRPRRRPLLRPPPAAAPTATPPRQRWLFAGHHPDQPHPPTAARGALLAAARAHCSAQGLGGGVGEGIAGGFGAVEMRQKIDYFLLK